MARKKATRPAISADQNITQQRIGPFVRSAMFRYGSKVIEDRAIPEMRDGLKPAQRRLLFSMHELGASSAGSFKKSSRVIGDTLGKYHPHGDAYVSLVGLASLRYPLVTPQGSFGNEFDPPAAARYTEVRLSPIADVLFDCLDVTTMVPNYSDEFREPLVISSRLPLVLLNGSEGIAVGLKNTVPSHNLREVIDALVYVAKAGSDATLRGALKHIKGPDCVSGGILVSSKEEIQAFYENGYGSLSYTCEYSVEPDEFDSKITCLRITGWPDSWPLENFVSKRIPKMMESNMLRSFDIIYDDTTCAVRELRIGVDNKPALDSIIKMLRRNVSYALNVTIRNSVDDIAFKPMCLLDILRSWISWRKHEEARILELRKKRVLHSLHLEQARLLAMQNLKLILRILDAEIDSGISAESSLSLALNCSTEIAKFILELRLRELRKADISAQRSRIAKIEADVASIDRDIADITSVVIRELLALRKFQDERRTKLGAESSAAELTVVAHGNTTAYGVTRDGKVFGDIQPTRTTATSDMFVVGSYQGITIIDSSGLAANLSKSEATGLQSKNFRSIVGIASSDYPYIVAVTADGSFIKVGNSTRMSEYPLSKSALLWASSATDDSILIVSTDAGSIKTVRVSDIPEGRRNGRGVRLLKPKPSQVAVVHPAHKIYSRAGDRISLSSLSSASARASDLLVVGKRNLVAYTTGRRAILSDSDAVASLSDPTLARLWTLDAPAS